jgi:hypothetical protein
MCSCEFSLKNLLLTSDLISTYALVTARKKAYAKLGPTLFLGHTEIRPQIVHFVTLYAKPPSAFYVFIAVTFGLFIKFTNGRG